MKSLLKEKPKYIGLRPGSDISKVKCYTCQVKGGHEMPTCKAKKKVGVKEKTKKNVDPEYIREICNLIREKEGKHNLLMQVKKEENALSYEPGEAKVLGNFITHYAS